MSDEAVDGIEICSKKVDRRVLAVTSVSRRGIKRIS
jgi:hypothetical protein